MSAFRDGGSLASTATKRGRASPDSTDPPTSRSWRGSNTFGSAPGCTSAPRRAGDCITSSTRWSTTRSTRRWPAAADRIIVRLRKDGSCRGRGRRPRHPGQADPQGEGPAARGRGRPHDAERGRQVRRRGVPDLGRPARRRGLGRERALAEADRRGDARRLHVDAELRARQGDVQAHQGQGHAQDRDDHHVLAGPRGVRGGRRVRRQAPRRAPAGARVPDQGRRDPADRRARRASRTSRCSRPRAGSPTS